MKKGKIIVIEGTDGSGKNTQMNLLAKKLEERKLNYRTISFPCYEKPSSSLVKMYLDGEFGDNAMDVSPYIASTFFAVDRYAAYITDFGKFYNDGGIVISDRYVSSNMLHQASKIIDKEEQKKFLNWLFDLEYNIYKIPKPDKVIFLNMPIEYSSKLLKNRDNRFEYKKEDIHEKNMEYMKKSYDTACELAKIYNWEEIKCVEGGKVREIDEISEEIEEKVKNIIEN